MGRGRPLGAVDESLLPRNAEIVQSYRDGMLLRDIAWKHSITTERVRQIVAARGLEPRRHVTMWFKKDERLLRELWRDFNASQIAEMLGNGHTRNSVIGKAHRMGLPHKAPPRKHELRA